MLKEMTQESALNPLCLVLILILMEHAQRGGDRMVIALLAKCLNPYFNGTCSKSRYGGADKLREYVLILILMEHAQRVHMLFECFNKTRVLILILMEHAQRACITATLVVFTTS